MTQQYHRSRIFLHNLPSSFAESDLRDLISEYKTVRRVDYKREYAYVSFEDEGEADDAVLKLDDREIDGKIIKVVNVTKNDVDKKQDVPNFEFRIRVHNLRPRTSWQDLKDWARNAGTVQFSNVFMKDSVTQGVIEFSVRLMSYDFWTLCSHIFMHSFHFITVVMVNLLLFHECYK